MSSNHSSEEDLRAASNRANVVVDDFMDKANDVEHFAEHAGKRTSEFIAKNSKRLAGLIKEHPFAAVAIAGGLGFTAYRLLRK